MNMPELKSQYDKDRFVEYAEYYAQQQAQYLVELYGYISERTGISMEDLMMYQEEFAEKIGIA